MHVKAGYDTDSQKAKGIKSNEQTAECSTSVLENRKDADVILLLHGCFCFCFCFFIFLI